MKPIPKSMFFLAGFLSLVLAMGCFFERSYSEEVRKALKDWGKDFSSYTFKSNPVSTFGVGTIYMDELLDPKAPPKTDWLIAQPSTWYANNVTDQEEMELDNRIFAKGTMGSTGLTEKISSSLTLKATFPNIAQVLNASAAVDYKKGVKVTLKASEAINRQMNWSEFWDAVEAGKMKPYVRDRIENYDIVIISQDIILKDFSTEIQVDQSVNPELNAKLNEAVGKTLGTDSELALGIRKKSEGVFEVTATNPVVAAVLFKHPPRPKPLPKKGKGRIVRLPPPDSLDQWETVLISNKVLDPVEKFLSDKGLPKTKE